MRKAISFLAIFIGRASAYEDCNMTRNVTGNFAFNHMKCNGNEDV